MLVTVGGFANGYQMGMKPYMLYAKLMVKTWKIASPMVVAVLATDQKEQKHAKFQMC